MGDLMMKVVHFRPDSLRTNPLARNLGQVKLDSDKWKLWKNLF